MQFLLILLFGIVTIVDAQPPDSVWSWTYDGGGTDFASDVVRTTDECWLVGGQTMDTSNGSHHVVLAKLDDAGDTLWVHEFPAAWWVGSSVGGMIAASDGGCIVGTVSEGLFPSSHVMRVSADGDTVWTRELELYADAAITAMCPAGGLDFIVAGVLWWWIDAGWGVEADTTFCLRMNADGGQVWLRKFDFAPGSGVSYILETPNAMAAVPGGFAFCGRAGFNSMIAKINGTGALQWTQLFAADSGYDYLADIAATEDGGLIAFGWSNPDTSEFTYLKLLKTNEAGEIEWFRDYGGPNYEAGYSIAAATDGYLLAGWIGLSGSMGRDFRLLKVALNGDSVWSRTFGGVGDDGLADMATDGNGSAVLVGYTTYAGSDWLVVGVDLGTGAEAPKEWPDRFLLSQNYPNPFNAATSISFDLPREEFVRLNVFDITGRIVATMADEVMEAGAHQVSWDASHVPSGVYIYRLESGSFIQSRKMVVLK